MYEFRLDLSINVIPRTTSTILCTRHGITAFGITRLNHEVLNHAVEEHIVIEAFLCQLNKIVTMQRCLVIEANSYIAQCCRYFYATHIILFLIVHAKISKKTEAQSAARRK